jgi:hypothetical protein
VQDFIPVREIKNGIVETADGRYIKILEIEPINFQLRSAEEQHNIIASFASWLKISPMKMQLKSIARKADSDNHIAMLREELEREDNPKCRELGEDYINLIRDVGNREALTRRFFLIFQYEAVSGRGGVRPDYGEVCGALQTVVQNARAYFLQCGNNIVQPRDEDTFTAEVLYMFFNRKSCVTEPFSSRLDRIVVDTMAAKRKTIGVDPVPRIRASNFIAPRGIDLTHNNYIVMDGMYYSFLYIRKDGFPTQVRAGWMSSLINAGEGVDVDIHLRRENRSRTIDKVAQRIRLNRTKLRGVQDDGQVNRHRARHDGVVREYNIACAYVYAAADASFSGSKCAGIQIYPANTDEEPPQYSVSEDGMVCYCKRVNIGGTELEPQFNYPLEAEEGGGVLLRVMADMLTAAR